MLCASVLTELKAATAPGRLIAPVPDDVASQRSSTLSSNEEDDDDDRPTASLSSESASLRVGAPRDFSGHADGTMRAYNSATKWVNAALRKLGKTTDDLVLPSFEPNDTLASEVHNTIAEWCQNRTIASDAGVVDPRPSELLKAPPKEILSKVRGWLLRHINQRRAENGISMIADEKWARKLAGVRADARAVNKKTKELKAESGELYHHKHDVAPTREQLMTMAYTGFSGDARVHADVLDAIEAGMAIALYMSTGARGSELKKMHLQSIGYEQIQHEQSGLEFACLKLTAFETKTKEQHINQLLPHANPWCCGVALLGLSLLVRVKLYGAPPFTMQTDERSWQIIGSSASTLDKRLKEVFKVAGVRRQIGDLLTYLGRHLGTRLLQHAGGSAEGGAARRGHSNGTASFHYTETPLPDLLRLACNDASKPFLPAHQQKSHYPLADAVILIIFPELHAEELDIEARQKEVDAMRGNADKVRTKEQLNDRERLVRSIRFACRMALCSLVARPRSWKQWTIVEDEPTVWQRAMDADHRVVKSLFAGNKDAIEQMNALALAVRRAEEAEIDARRASPDQAITTQVVGAITDMREAAAAREAKMLEQQQALYRQLASWVGASGEDAPSPPQPLPPPPAEAPPLAPPVASTVTTTALSCARLKHKREAQYDVAYFSSWPDMGLALSYAKEELAPREKEHGHTWRVRKRSDGREDKARDKEWRCYRSVAIAVGVLMRDGRSYEDAVAEIQARFESFGMKPHTRFLSALNEEIKQMRKGAADGIAADVLGF